MISFIPISKQYSLNSFKLRSLFLELQVRQAIAILSRACFPPLLIAVIWSKVSFLFSEPQYEHRPLALLNNSDNFLDDMDCFTAPRLNDEELNAIAFDIPGFSFLHFLHKPSKNLAFFSLYFLFIALTFSGLFKAQRLLFSKITAIFIFPHSFLINEEQPLHRELNPDFDFLLFEKDSGANNFLHLEHGFICQT